MRNTETITRSSLDDRFNEACEQSPILKTALLLHQRGDLTLEEVLKFACVVFYETLASMQEDLLNAAMQAARIPVVDVRKSKTPDPKKGEDEHG